MTGIYDMHCHIVPGVDDGCRTLKDSMKLIEKEYKDGVRHIILTPHFRRDMFETSTNDILKAYVELKQKVKETYPDMELFIGREYHSNMDMCAHVAKNPYLRMAESNYVLLEFSGADKKAYIRERIGALIAAGYRPILAHAERYYEIAEDISFARELVRRGAMIQVNADTLLGHEGRKSKRFALELIEEDLLSFVGSDAHNMLTRPCRIGKAAQWVEKEYGIEYARQLFIENPARIVKG